MKRDKIFTLLTLPLFALALTCFGQSKIIIDETITSNDGTKTYIIVKKLSIQPPNATTTVLFTANASTSYIFRSGDLDTQNFPPPPPNGDKNFVRTETILKSGVTDETTIASLTVNDKSTDYAYFDGVGRTTQTIGVQASPAQNDVVKFQQYDGFGRQGQEYLPYSIASQKGAYRADPQGEVSNFYKTASAVSVDDEPYKLNVFDDSPLNQVRKVYGAGKEWHTNFKGAASKILTNSATDAVRFFTYTGVSPAPPYYNLPTLAGTYPANTLTVEESIDEEGQVKRVFKNFKGQVVLSRVGDATKWYDTYYVYDWEGNVFCVFPPEASAKLATASNYETASDYDRNIFLDNYAFKYEYDQYQRAVGKKIPGAAWAYTVYDKWDRVVMTWNGSEGPSQSQQWMFTKYDEFNRPILTGSFYIPQNSYRSDLQYEVDYFYNYTSPYRFETRQNDATGYTQNRTYPVNPAEGDLLTVTYYDDYAFTAYTNWDAEGKSYAYVQENNLPAPTALLTTYKGYTTGSKVRVVGDTRWLNSVTYYDNKYRVIQTITENHLNGTDRLSNDIDFAGRTQKTFRTHTTTGNSFTLLEKYDYDHAGRVLRTWQTLDGASSPTLVSSQAYNEAGEVIEKNIHSTDNGTTFLQSVDYRYNIRGWLTSINNSSLTNDANVNPDNASSSPDVMGMELLYNTAEAINGTNTRQLWNGNIGAIKWKTTNLIDPATEKIYGYNYDVLNRLLTATYATRGASDFTSNVGAYNNIYGYDDNGNIKTQTRNGLVGGTLASIDNLDYGWYPGGNRLRYLNDFAVGYTQFGAKGFGFVEKTNLQGNEYVYDARGNATQDLNKGIDVTYNHLSMPTRVDFGSNTYIQYTYDALGNKLKGKTYQNGSVIAERDYIGGVHYDGGTLAFLSVGDGRAIKTGTLWQYEYFMRDHQGNTLATFGNLKDANVYKACMETDNANKATYEQNTFRNISDSRRSIDYNSTTITGDIPNPRKSIVTNGTGSTNVAMGPGLRLTVNPGDRIKMSVNARTITPSSGAAVDVIAGSLLSIVTAGYGLNPGEPAYNGFSNKLDGALATVIANSGSPKAYLNYMLFGNSYTSNQFGYVAVSTTAATKFEKLEIEIIVPAGYSGGDMFIYTTNESNYNAYFDDVYVLHEKTNNALQVTQLSDYYPFGLAFNTWNKESIKANRYLYQKQESQDDLGYDEYQYKYRMHDPAMGRFLSVDPLSEKYMYNSTYAFAENRVIDGIELEGKEYAPTFDKVGYGNNRYLNSLYVVNNFAVDIFNTFPNTWNSGVDFYKTWDRIGWGGIFSNLNRQISEIPGEISSEWNQRVDYAKNTPLSTQWNNFLGSVDNAKNWEAPISFGLTALTTKNFYSSISNMERAAISEVAVPSRGSSLIQTNRKSGNLFRDELAAALRSEGRVVNTEAYKWTPFGKRFIDLDVWHNGVNLGGIETKVGGSRYHTLQRLKDAWLGANGYEVQLVRKPLNWNITIGF